MQQLILMIHVLLAIAVIVLVLLQQGQGAQMGAAFGSGASQTLFGSRGSASFLVKVTALFAGLFFATSLILGYIAAHQVRVDPLQALTSPVGSTNSRALVDSHPIKNDAAGATSGSLPNAGVPLPEHNELPPVTQ